MKVSVAALLLLILATTSASYFQPRHPVGVNIQASCCVTYYEKTLPQKLVKGYREALTCHLPAIIFVTKKNREVCANPNDSWVQDYIKDPQIPLLPPKNSASVKIIRTEKGQP
uniref:C-C motif chemokine ligand 16 n=1 Tax=Urocitellus parryii TaxID=9999 RepID=A0A8D2KL21_UROPR|nr:C-C motif chemokine 16 [Urocitellus parryii]